LAIGHVLNDGLCPGLSHNTDKAGKQTVSAGDLLAEYLERAGAFQHG